MDRSSPDSSSPGRTEPSAGAKVTGEAYTFDDVLLAPRHSLTHPKDVSTTSRFTRGIARELGEHRIRVNVITPGWIMTERQLTKWLDAKGEEELHRNQVLPDKVRPEDVAPLALFLASDDSRAMSAREYIVDAGWL